MTNPKLISNQEELWYHRTHETSNAEIKDHKNAETQVTNLYIGCHRKLSDRT